MAKTQTKNETPPKIWDEIKPRFSELAKQYAKTLSQGQIFDAFSRAGLGMANMAQIQNARVKAISSLPADFTKEEIGAFLRDAYNNEQELRKTAETLKWTAYPFAKIVKTYADIPTYRHYAIPEYVTSDDTKSDEFLREAKLVDKISKALSPQKTAHKIVGQAMAQGKVFYTIRYNIDKAHNRVNAAFMQQLPTDWCYIIGYNSVSGYTVSFNMFYFLQPGTDVTQYGDLFKPYLEDFDKMFSNRKPSGKYIYASKREVGYSVPCKGKTLDFFPDRINKNAQGNPKVFQQSGRWAYFVTLPIEKVWTFEIDDATPAVASPLSGLMLTYAQQSDYEAAQLSLLLNPLIKIFTGEIEYFEDNGTTKEDNYRLSEAGRLMYQMMFDQLMDEHNTGGTAFYSAPVKNIKSHDFTESVNANAISETFNRYGMQKAGLSGLLPASSDIKASQVAASQKIESRYSTAAIYPQFERMMNTLYRTIKLKYDWRFRMFGTIFDEAEIRESAEKAITNGDTSQYFVLSALDGHSWLDKLAMMNTIADSGLLEKLTPPATSYTMSGSEMNGENGRPKEEEMSESLEKAIDSGVTE